MIVRSRRAFALQCGFALVAPQCGLACGGAVDDAPAHPGDAGSIDGGACLRHPPSRPDGAPSAAAITPTVLAVRSVDFGDALHGPWNVQPSVGFDLDDRASTRESTDTCKPVAGANPANTKNDGECGIDNSFGSNIAPLIASVAATERTAGELVSATIASGAWTLSIDLANLHTRADQVGIRAFVVEVERSAPPTWDGADDWQVSERAVLGRNIDTPRSRFDDGYINAGVWVSGTSDVQLEVDLGRAFGFAAGLVPGSRMTLHHARLTLEPADGNGATTRRGTLVGVLNAEEFVNALRSALPECWLLCDVCPDQQIRATSDLLLAPASDPSTQTCDGISFGMSFTAEPARLGGIAPTPPPWTPCGADAGADGGA